MEIKEGPCFLLRVTGKCQEGAKRCKVIDNRKVPKG